MTQSTLYENVVLLKGTLTDAFFSPNAMSIEAYEKIRDAELVIAEHHGKRRVLKDRYGHRREIVWDEASQLIMSSHGDYTVIEVKDGTV